MPKKKRSPSDLEKVAQQIAGVYVASELNTSNSTPRGARPLSGGLSQGLLVAGSPSSSTPSHALNLKLEARPSKVPFSFALSYLDFFYLFTYSLFINIL